jgi:hypothetical protein
MIFPAVVRLRAVSFLRRPNADHAVSGGSELASLHGFFFLLHAAFSLQPSFIKTYACFFAGNI